MKPNETPNINPATLSPAPPQPAGPAPIATPPQPTGSIPMPVPVPVPVQTPASGQAQPVQQQLNPKKPNSTLGTVAKTLGAVLVVAIAVLTIFVFTLMSSTGKAAEQAEGFAAELMAKDLPAAYDYFSEEVKSEQSLVEFESIMASAPFDESCTYSISGRGVSSESGGTTKKTLTGAIECTDSTFPVELIFIGEDDTEKIAGYDIKPAQ